MCLKDRTNSQIARRLRLVVVVRNWKFAMIRRFPRMRQHSHRMFCSNKIQQELEQLDVNKPIL